VAGCSRAVSSRRLSRPRGAGCRMPVHVQSCPHCMRLGL
jgi:hypothetical protein